MAFCEQCGAKLEAGMRFCESCGAPVSIEECAAKDYSAPASQDESMTLFSEADWTVKWMKAAASCADTELGILMTRGSALAEQLGVSVDEIRGVLSSYIAAMKKHGVGYYYLDLDDCPFYKGSGDVESTVGALRLIVDVALPKYLFIIGNEDIIDVARWENRAEDTDGSVESDLCYATLDVNSPWDGQAYNFGEVLRVGRFPTCVGESIEEFKHYFNATPQCTERLGELTPYGLSALVWEDESNDEYRAISHKTVDVSPNVTKESVGHTIPVDANLMFFNLHGSNDTRYWYGQDGGEYPEAFFPGHLVESHNALSYWS